MFVEILIKLSCAFHKRSANIRRQRAKSKYCAKITFRNVRKYLHPEKK
jgi:hypothetical protein